MKFICPTLGDGDERDFLVTGSPDSFKIIVFSDMDSYNDGFDYLEIIDYEPLEVSANLFKELASNDDAFEGLILNIHSQKKIISKEDVLEL